MTSTPRILSGIVQQLKHLSTSQKVTAENIANDTTPGYKARTMQAPDFSALLAGSGVTAGAPRIQRPRIEITGGMASLGARPPQAGSSSMLDRDVGETKPDGNNVTLEEQLLKMGETQAEFASMTNLYRKHMALLRMAVGPK